jgi:hypothetical protein
MQAAFDLIRRNKKCGLGLLELESSYCACTDASSFTPRVCRSEAVSSNAVLSTLT